MISHETPSRPLEKFGCVDYFSDYFEVDRIFGKKGKEVISRLESQFARHGIPDQFISANGPLFSSREFQDFHWPISLSTSQVLQGILNRMGKLRMQLRWLKIS